MSMYENLKAAMNNAVPTVSKPNQRLYDTSSIENDKVKAFVEAKSEAANAVNEMDSLKAQSQFYFRTDNDFVRNSELRAEADDANNRAKASVQNVNWDDISKEDYAAALNASCGIENKQGGLDEKIQNKALIKLTLDSMSKEDIARTFDMFMTPAEQEKWLKGIANDERYKQYIPDEATLNAYVEETKNAMLDREPRPDPTNAMSIDSAVMDMLEDVHEKHTAELSQAMSSSKEQTTYAVESTVETPNKKGPFAKLKSRFSTIPNSPDTPNSGGLSL